MAAFIAIAVVLGLAVLAVLLRPLWKHTHGLALGIGAVLAVSAGLLWEELERRRGEGMAILLSSHQTPPADPDH